VQQFAVDVIRNAGEWSIVLDVRPRLNARYTRRGKSKYTFRHINKYSPNKEVFEKAVRKALQSVSLQSSRRFLRKAN